MTESAQEENEEFEKKGLMFFGVDLTRIECMRSSLLNGYVGAAVGGVGGFMYTSKTKIACHAAFASFWIVTFSSWFMCRYQKYMREKEWNRLQKSIKKKREFSKDEYHVPEEFRSKDEKKVEVESEKKG